MGARRIGRYRAFVLLALAAFAWAACRPEPVADPSPSPSPSPIPATATTDPTGTQLPPSATEAPTQTATAASTMTPVAESTVAPSPTPTETPLPEVVAVVIQEFASVRSGPAEVFDRLITLTAGMAVTLTGRDAAGEWFFADLMLGQGGWISSASVRIEGEVESLAILEISEIPTATPTSGLPPVIIVVDINTLILQNFKLHENVIITVVKVEIPETGESRNCIITDPAETLCGLFNLNKIGVIYQISAQGDQDSFAEITYTREE